MTQSLSAFPDLYAFSRFLLVRHSSELPSLARRFPALSSVSPILEEVLREQELRTLFAETPHFSPEASCGISAMCSVNRLLLREKRFDELQKVSDDPEALRNLFREFRAKGFFAYKKDPCRLHRSQEKREKYIWKSITALLKPIIDSNCDESVSERGTFFEKVLRNSKLFAVIPENTP